MKRIAVWTAMFAFAPMMHAQYLTTWVASYGNDASNCLRDFPCRTFAAAYVKTDSQGTIRAVDAADYGAISISKPITLDGGDSGATIVATNKVGIVVTPGLTDVVNIRNINIHTYTPEAILVFMNGTSVANIENVTITGDLAGGGISALVNAPASSSEARLNLSNVSIAGTLTGVQMSAGRLTADRLTVHTKYNAFEVGKAAEKVVVRNSAFHASNNGDAIIIGNDKASVHPLSVVIDRCEFSQSNTGIMISQYASSPVISVYVSDSVITQNLSGIRFYGATPQAFSFRNNIIAGNVSDEPSLTSASFK